MSCSLWRSQVASSTEASMTPDLSSTLNSTSLPRWPLMMRISLTMPATVWVSRLSLRLAMGVRTNWRTSSSTSSNRWPER
ncbi:hypothetical protein D3C72_1227770 [compost metagenome]